MKIILASLTLISKSNQAFSILNFVFSGVCTCQEGFMFWYDHCVACSGVGAYINLDGDCTCPEFAIFNVDEGKCSCAEGYLSYNDNACVSNRFQVSTNSNVDYEVLESVSGKAELASDNIRLVSKSLFQFD